jgi:hypothetical protein
MWSLGDSFNVVQHSHFWCNQKLEAMSQRPVADDVWADPATRKDSLIHGTFESSPINRLAIFSCDRGYTFQPFAS